MKVLRSGSTNVITLSSLFDTIDLEYEEGATVTYTLYDENDAEITDAVDVEMPQVSGTSGRTTLYRGEVSYLVTLPTGVQGKCEVTAIATSGKRRVFEVPVRYEE